MLSSLSIKNFATISAQTIDFSSGFSALTGDTGAGKSLLLSALNLALGGKTNLGVIRHGCDKTDIIAVFDISNNQLAQQFLLENDLDDEAECLIRRTLTSDGRSKITVNAINTTLRQVRDLADYLVKIYGQNTHQTLLESSIQQQIIDSYADNFSLLKEVAVLVSAYQGNQQKIKKLLELASTQQYELDKLKNQLSELDQAELNQDELDNIQQNHRVGSRSQELLQDSNKIITNLEGDYENQGLQDQLNNIANKLADLQNIDPKLTSVSQLVESASVQLQEAGYELTQYLSKAELDPQQQAKIELRLSELNTLAHQHQCQIPELLSIQSNLLIRRSEINQGGQEQLNLEQENQLLHQQYQTICAKISQKRQQAGVAFSSQIADIMKTLGMPNCQFNLEWIVNQKTLSKTGTENVLFTIKVNAGQRFESLAHAISGGELSRLNLAIAMVVNKHNTVPSMIFDEVDAGISGGVAEVVGKSLNSLSGNYQILCITHLAQVAAQAHQHLLIKKTQDQNKTHSKIVLLNKAQRVDELARILDGVNITQAAKKVAKNLLDN